MHIEHWVLVPPSNWITILLSCLLYHFTLSHHHFLPMRYHQFCAQKIHICFLHVIVLLNCILFLHLVIFNVNIFHIESFCFSIFMDIFLLLLKLSFKRLIIQVLMNSTFVLPVTYVALLFLPNFTMLVNHPTTHINTNTMGHNKPTSQYLIFR